MAEQNTANVNELKDSDTWMNVPYQVRFGEEFHTLRDAMKFMGSTYGNQVNTVAPDVSASADTGGVTNALGIDMRYMGRTFFRDTRLGSNDAINCLWQFNRDDDIVHTVLASEPLQSNEVYPIGEGRVYASTTEMNQTIAWFSFGVGKFTDVAKFYTSAFEKDMIIRNNTGISGASIGRIFGDMAMLAFTLPLIPLQWMVNLITQFNNLNVSRFYDIRLTMHLYYTYVDTMMAQWLVAAGIYSGRGKDSAMQPSTAAASQKELEELLHQSPKPGAENDNGGDAPTGGPTWTASQDSLPLSLKLTGPSMWEILSRRAQAMGVSDAGSVAKWQAELERLQSLNAEEYDAISEWSGQGLFSDNDDIIIRTAAGATQFVGFRVEKSTDANESFSNSTGPSSMAQKINSQVSDMMERKYDTGGFGGDTGMFASVKEFIGDAWDAITDIFSMGGAAEAWTNGAFIDIPDQYKGSDFSKSHSLNFQLRSPYGDVVSIYQSIIVPLCMLLAGALPKAAGPNSYSQPFLCRVYVKGMFMIPLGIIDNISIKRGASEFGWTYQNLPTCVDVSVSIRDLSPAIYMAMGNTNIKNVFGVDNTFEEYMNTLAGLGLYERISRFQTFRRKIQLLAHQTRTRYLNPRFWDNWVGESTLAQFVFSVLTPNRRPNR